MKLSEYADNLRKSSQRAPPPEALGGKPLSELAEIARPRARGGRPRLPREECVCDWCGKKFVRRSDLIKSELIYCSNSCSMTVLARRRWSDAAEESKWEPRQSIPADTVGLYGGWSTYRVSVARMGYYSRLDSPGAYEEDDPAQLIEAARERLVYAEVVVPRPPERDVEPWMRLEYHAIKYAERHRHVVDRLKWAIRKGQQLSVTKAEDLRSIKKGGVDVRVQGVRDEVRGATDRPGEVRREEGRWVGDFLWPV